MSGLFLTILPLVVTFLLGRHIEQKHYASIRERERNLQELIAINFEQTPADWQIERSELVMGTVVISLDYFKRFVANLRGIFGGRIRVYEPLLDRARREAILRMKNAAQAGGYHAIINTRIETSRLASSGQNGKGTVGIEILAFGTAVKIQGS